MVFSFVPSSPFGFLVLTALSLGLSRWVRETGQIPFHLNIRQMKSSAINADYQAKSNGHRCPLCGRYLNAGTFVGHR